MSDQVQTAASAIRSRLGLQIDTARVRSSSAPVKGAFKLLLCAAAMVLAGCAAQMPKNVPESISEFGAEPQIPEEYMGCWRGTLTEFDTVHSFVPLIPDRYIASGIAATTYELCFTTQPDGTRKLELTDVDIPGHLVRVTSFRNRIISIDTELRRAWMRNHVVAESTFYILFFPMHSTQDVYAEEQLQIISPDLIKVSGTQTVFIGKERIAEMTFHTDFHHVPDRRYMGGASNTNHPVKTPHAVDTHSEEKL